MRGKTGVRPPLVYPQCSLPHNSLSVTQLPSMSQQISPLRQKPISLQSDNGGHERSFGERKMCSMHLVDVFTSKGALGYKWRRSLCNVVKCIDGSRNSWLYNLCCYISIHVWKDDSRSRRNNSDIAGSKVSSNNTRCEEGIAFTALLFNVLVGRRCAAWS